MNSADFIIILILCLFALNGFIRGFLDEIKSFAGLLLGLLLARRYAYIIVPYISSLPQVLVPSLSFIFVALIGYIITNIAITFLTPILETIFTSIVNKTAGVFAGLFKGFICCTAIVYVANILFSTNATLQNSVMAGILTDAAAWLLETTLNVLPQMQISLASII